MPTGPRRGVPGDPSPGKTRRVQREDRAAELLAAATELFLTRGYAGTAMADVSAPAGVARNNVYGYYWSGQRTTYSPQWRTCVVSACCIGLRTSGSTSHWPCGRPTSGSCTRCGRWCTRCSTGARTRWTGR
ncbi:TetR family transcriptional regulator [Streptomyces sp. NPDC020299]|uniref:TetR family transcriptional regulator n=1 Tax=Streptomyces sp. NPDC020299 TaxID=3365067 RepID=UPI0037B486F8